MDAFICVILLLFFILIFGIVLTINDFITKPKNNKTTKTIYLTNEEMIWRWNLFYEGEVGDERVFEKRQFLEHLGYDLKFRNLLYLRLNTI